MTLLFCSNVLQWAVEQEGDVNEATDLQMQVLAAIKKLLCKTAQCPTVREIAIAVGMKNTNCVFTKLKSLQKKGLIEWENEGKSRAVWPTGWRDEIKKTLKHLNKSKS